MRHIWVFGEPPNAQGLQSWSFFAEENLENWWKLKKKLIKWGAPFSELNDNIHFASKY